MILKLYDGQFGEVIRSSGPSTEFNITGGVRQGCVLSPIFLRRVTVCNAEMEIESW